jgi:cytochrome P450
VSFWQAWRYALGAVGATWRHTIFEYADTLPGYADIVSARTPLVKLLIVRDPEYARQILVTNQDNYGKSTEYDLLGVAFGRGLVTNLDDETWRARRQIVQPVFGKRHVDGFAGQMTDAIAAACVRWERDHADGTPLDVAAEMNAVTLDIVGRTMFGADLTGSAAARMRDAFARLLRAFGEGVMSGASYHARMIAAILRRLRVARDARLAIRLLRAFLRIFEPRTYRGLVWIESFVSRMLAAHHADPERPHDNLLALLVQASDPETGARLSDNDIRDELMTFLGAGHETTASVLPWTWMLLARHPAVRERLQAEVDAVLAGRTPTADDLERLPWTKAIVEESMRLYPPVLGVARVARNDDVIGGIRIRAGATLVVLMHGVHHNPDVWSDPLRFDPGRFMPEAPPPPSRQASMPFGAGRRMCVAATFARLEATLIIAMVSQRFELELLPQPRIRRENTFTGGPEGSVWMRLQPR